MTQDLLDRTVPKEEIVLAFYHPEDRQLTEFAIASSGSVGVQVINRRDETSKPLL